MVRRLDLRFRDVDWTRWNDLLDRVHHPKEEVTIALVGKYVDLHDAYLSVCEALRAGGFANHAKVVIRWVPSTTARLGGRGRILSEVGVVIPGGFGIRGVEGKVGAIRYARENQIPILGLCLGLQCMVIEVARHMAGLDGADSSEFAPDTPHPVIATMAEQVAIVEGGGGDLGGSMRLGSYPAELLPGSIVAKRYGQAHVEERHRHRYEVNNAYRDRLEDAGLVISGTSPDTKLVEFIELPSEIHPYFVATQAHPELKSRPTQTASALRRSRRGGAGPQAGHPAAGRQRPSMIILGPDELTDTPLAWPSTRRPCWPSYQLCARSGEDARRALDRAGVSQAPGRSG